MNSKHPAVSAHARGAVISIQVQPRASKTEVAGLIEDRLKMRVAAPPVDDAANQEIITFLSNRIGVPKSAVSILNGERARRKLILVEGVDGNTVIDALGLV